MSNFSYFTAGLTLAAVVCGSASSATADECAKTFLAQDDNTVPSNSYDAYFEVQLTKNTGNLNRFALKFASGKHELAEDFVQQTRINAWQARHSWHQQSKMSSWLYQICYRVALDYYRRLRRRVTEVTTSEIYDPEAKLDILDLDSSLSAFPIQFQQPGDIDQEEIDGQLQKILLAVAGIEQGTMLYLYVVKQLSYEEIGEYFSTPEETVPAGTVRSRIFRAKEKLKKAILSGAVHLPTEALNHEFIDRALRK